MLRELLYKYLFSFIVSWRHDDMTSLQFTSTLARTKSNVPACEMKVPIDRKWITNFSKCHSIFVASDYLLFSFSCYILGISWKQYTDMGFQCSKMHSANEILKRFGCRLQTRIWRWQNTTSRTCSRRHRVRCAYVGFVVLFTVARFKLDTIYYSFFYFLSKIVRENRNKVHKSDSKRTQTGETKWNSIQKASNGSHSHLPFWLCLRALVRQNWLKE